jgi:diaminopimelate epimerase
MNALVLACCGNTFAVLTRPQLPEPPGPFARAQCERGFQGRPLDGVLVLEYPERGGDLRMVVYNADGSRPEACGDGLLCVAVHARTALGLERKVRVETDSGTQVVDVTRDDAEGGDGRGSLGVPRVEAESELRAAGRSYAVRRVDVGNPHCVLFVEDVEHAPVDEVGSALQQHPEFPAGTNVEFVRVERERICARVFERGVGETPACGTGAVALAFAAAEAGLVDLPVAVDYPGGRLLVGRGAAGEAWIEGTVKRFGVVPLVEASDASATGTASAQGAQGRG